MNSIIVLQKLQIRIIQECNECLHFSVKDWNWGEGWFHFSVRSCEWDSSESSSEMYTCQVANKHQPNTTIAKSIRLHGMPWKRIRLTEIFAYKLIQNHHHNHFRLKTRGVWGKHYRRTVLQLWSLAQRHVIPCANTEWSTQKLFQIKLPLYHKS